MIPLTPCRAELISFISVPGRPISPMTLSQAGEEGRWWITFSAEITGVFPGPSRDSICRSKRKFAGLADSVPRQFRRKTGPEVVHPPQ